ncbi:MAG: NnrS family protein [Sedimenticola sp.]
MLKMFSEPPKPKLTYRGPVVLALGFRPFFLLAGLSAALLMGLWLAFWGGSLPTDAYYGSIGWHSHEMLFGYTTAVAGGFLLTAVRNWTGVNTPMGRPLGILVALWLVGRLAGLLSGMLPGWLIALADMLFLPALAMSIKPALWMGQQKVNRIFVPLLLAMALANLLTHLQALGIANTGAAGTDMMLQLVMLLVLIITGRIIPAFTGGALPLARPKRYPSMETATPILVCTLIVIQLLFPAPWLLGAVSFAIAVTQAIRFSGWHHPNAWRIPILWVLYSGFIWIIIGFLMLGLAPLELFPANHAKHALTVGGIGVLTLGMMSRVSLGHTGRPIISSALVNLSFLLLNIGVAIRVFAPIIAPAQYTAWIHLSGGVWTLCFLVFFLSYLPILTKPRIDGRPG